MGVLELFAALGEPSLVDDTPAAARARRQARIRPPSEDIHHSEDLEAGGVPARLYRPTDQVPLALLVYLHGGGWVLGSVAGSDNTCRALANRSGVAVLSVDYRLAPEHPFPAALEDALTATRWAYDHAGELGVDNSRLAIGGDSAGGNLAAVVAQLGPVPLRFQLLIYPVTDLRGGSPSYAEHGDGYYLTTSEMTWFVAHYLSGGRGSVEDARVSPLLADDAAMAVTPPALVVTAEYDPLRDDGLGYVERLRAAGVEVTSIHYDSMMHGFVSLADFLDDGQAALTEAAVALGRALT
jgi:acetyl esterase